jgi:hypothetical protein
VEYYLNALEWESKRSVQVALADKKSQRAAAAAVALHWLILMSYSTTHSRQHFLLAIQLPSVLIVELRSVRG